MSRTVRNILAIILGVVLGSATNMAIIMISGSVIAPPEGVDPSNMDSLVEAMPNFKPRHFIFPFLAHALGTFVGAAAACLIATEKKLLFALGIALVFLVSGIAMVYMLPAPKWFEILDLTLAYIPMALFAWILTSRRKEKSRSN